MRNFDLSLFDNLMLNLWILNYNINIYRNVDKKSYAAKFKKFKNNRFVLKNDFCTRIIKY